MNNLTVDMDVLVEWTNGTENVVSSAELEAIPPAKTLSLKTGSRVRMNYKGKYYPGTVVATEDDEESLNLSPYHQNSSDSDDDLPLANFAVFDKKNKSCHNSESPSRENILEKSCLSEKSPSSVQDEIANRPDSSEPIPCVVCGREIFAACVNCSAVVCYDHFFEENVDCAEEHISLAIIRSNLENNLPANSEPESCVVCGREKFEKCGICSFFFFFF